VDFKAVKSKSKSIPKPDLWSVAELSSFYTQNRSELITHANRILNDYAKAEEITQEALVKFMLAAPELESKEHALAYLHRSIENLCIDLFRVQNRRPNLVSLDDCAAEVETTWQVSGDYAQVISAAEDAAIIRQALSLLSAAERAALVMWEIEGRSTKEIANELGIKESAVRHTVSRARATLRKILSELIVDDERGLTALDLLSKTYTRAAKVAGKSSKVALTFILVLTAFLGLNSITGNETNVNNFSNSGSQLYSDQDLPKSFSTPDLVNSYNSPKSDLKSVSNSTIINSLSIQEYSDHMSLASAQLETVTLMLVALDQTEFVDTSIEIP
jgi:RNA polymerase sigma factor (sigma-70 family)